MSYEWTDSHQEAAVIVGQAVSRLLANPGVDLDQAIALAVGIYAAMFVAFGADEDDAHQRAYDRVSAMSLMFRRQMLAGRGGSLD